LQLQQIEVEITRANNTQTHPTALPF